MNALYLAWKYWTHYRFRSGTLTLCLALTFCAPLTLKWITSGFEKSLIRRAELTPMVLGSPGSSIDLTLHALYFQTQAPSEISYSEVDALESHQLGYSVPLFAKYQARGFPLVGTTLDYFSQRGLSITKGALFVTLGDCVIGAEVADELQLNVGDSLLATTENVFDIAGAYPLKMKIRGILSTSGGPDDRAVFADLKTTWILDGIGHGHQDLESSPVPENLTFSQSQTQIVANAALNQYTEITESNLDSFHFHGDMGDYPLTAVLIFPDNQKSRALLLGRYEGSETTQISICLEEVRGLLGMVFRAKQFFDLNHALFVGVSILFLTLTLALSWKLRQKEFDTLHQIGSPGSFVIKMLVAELVLLLIASAVLTALLSAALYGIASSLLKNSIF